MIQWLVVGKNSEGSNNGMSKVYLGSWLEAEEKHETPHFTHPVSRQRFERSIFWLQVESYNDLLGNTVLELCVSWQGIATSWRTVKRLAVSWLKNKIWKDCLSSVPRFQKGNCFFFKVLTIRQLFLLIRAVLRWKWVCSIDGMLLTGGKLGEKRVAVLLRTQKNSRMLARFLTFDMRHRLPTIRTMSRHLKTEY